MTEAEKKVIEAAIRMIKISALQALDAEQAEPDYKWLAMNDAGVALGLETKPEYKCGNWYRGTKSYPMSEKPSFLKPCQLWERVKYVGVNDCGEFWNGSWWRLYADYSEKKDVFAETWDTPEEDKAWAHLQENDMEFKKGDLVRHKPSGCVAEFDHEWTERVVVKVPCRNMEKETYLTHWNYVDCEPAKQPVDGDYHEGWEEGFKAGQKQPVDAGLYEAAKEIDNLLDHSSYAPCSEEDAHTMQKFSDAIANSTPVEPQGWIVDRKPTKEDAWEDLVVVWADNMDCIAFVNWYDVVESQAWQPVSLSLRTPPEQPEPRCELCTRLWHSTDGTPLCSLGTTDSDGVYHVIANPQPGHNKCDFKPKEK